MLRCFERFKGIIKCKSPEKQTLLIGSCLITSGAHRLFLEARIFMVRVYVTTRLN